VLIGVNSDSKERVETAIEENGITWRSFWDGGSTGGPIASAWSVRGWPTIYVIDDRGLVRHKNVRGEALDEAVAELVDEALGNLVQDLASEDAAVRGLAAFRLGKYQAADAKPNLVKLLEDAKPIVRQRAAVGLALLGEPSEPLLPALRKAAGDADAEVRAAGLLVLGKAGDKRSATLAIKALKDGQIEVRRTAIAVLGMLKPSSALAPLAKAVEDPDPETAKTAALALAEFKTAASAARLKQLAADAEHPARVWIAVAMHRTGAEGTAARFARLLDDQDAKIRRPAVAALGELADFDATELYIQALADKNAKVSAIARSALSDSQDPNASSTNSCRCFRCAISASKGRQCAA